MGFKTVGERVPKSVQKAQIIEKFTASTIFNQTHYCKAKNAKNYISPLWWERERGIKTVKIFEPEKMRVRVCAEKKEQEFLSLKTDALHGPL